MISGQISIKPSSIARLLGTIALCLILASIAGMLMKYVAGHPSVHGLVPLFDVDTEMNFPTLFSMFLLLFAALLLSVIALLEKKRLGPHITHWTILTIGFLVMAIDELGEFHERLVWPVRNLLVNVNLGFFYFAWVIPAIVLILVLAIFFTKFLLHLNIKTRLTFISAAILYLGGAIGFELIGGHYAELRGLENLTFSILTQIEESLEMAGAIVFIWGLMVYIADNFSAVQFVFESAPGKTSSLKYKD